ncbi:MAG: Methionine aminopeptidase [Candidatus Jorgensenbacteria bacterium GW2011_GWA2_45_9]|uniref:Methionine aminopeptidase n=1 Tax=Candidatus Jorgensenbacteria bacterium GW2011_GWA2_45_9 TaxID=1618663 RepID=A0A0G1QDM9_9BACT|nr:MAG: Methionine aminopeptidase [Candidatus Jorgensenbacteria bacterium GW2011_GWA2_45_9]
MKSFSQIIKTKEDIKTLRESGAILAFVLNELKKNVQTGVKTRSLDALAREMLKERGARPAFLNYRPEGTLRAYPAAICISINNKIVHGVPGERRIREGDVVKIDIGVEYKGRITDAAATVGVGKLPDKLLKLVEATEEALYDGIGECVPGKHLGDIGYAIEARAKRSNVSVVRGLTGHGVGFKVHEEPMVYNFGKKGTGIKLMEGMVLAIEPMFAAGSDEIIELPDESFATKDGSVSAHFEHTVAITEEGAEVLTK